MNVLGHDDVREDVEVVLAPSLFEGVFEEVSCCRGVEVGETVVTTEVDGVIVAFSVITLQTGWHVWMLLEGARVLGGVVFEVALVLGGPSSPSLFDG